MHPSTAAGPGVPYDHEPYVQALLTARQQRVQILDPVLDWSHLTEPEAYRIMLEVGRRLDWPPLGWKIAATNPELQRRLRTQSPVIGRTFRQFLHSAPAVLACCELLDPVVECEFFERIGAALPPRDRPYSVDEVSDAVDAVFIGVEVAECRFPGRQLFGTVEAEEVAKLATLHLVSAELVDNELFGHGGDKATFSDRFGQRIAYFDLGQALLGSHPAEGLACLLRAEDLARQIKDPMADRIRDFIDGLRADHLSADDFERELAAIRDRTQALMDGLFSQLQAAVEAGELDLYAAPQAAGGR